MVPALDGTLHWPGLFRRMGNALPQSIRLPANALDAVAVAAGGCFRMQPRCKRCNRLLKSTKSQQDGYGPVCLAIIRKTHREDRQRKLVFRK